jgi:hypothetical protein
MACNRRSIVLPMPAQQGPPTEAHIICNQDAANRGCLQGGSDRMRTSLTPDTWRAIGYARDGLVILVIAIGGMYVLSNPAKIDAFLNWMAGRH